MNKENLAKRLNQHLVKIYGESSPSEEITFLTDNIVNYLADAKDEIFKDDKIQSLNKWSEKSILLITYANSITSDSEIPLKTLNNFLNSHLSDLVSIVHILPFFPSSSDHGFSVVDYYSVDSKYGSWDEVKKLALDFNVMYDVVLNHGSSKSDWFQNFLNCEGFGSNFFYTANKDVDTSLVTRPRTNELLNRVNTKKGDKYVWCTFSSDQIDYDFSNSEVLKEFIKIIIFYLKQGATVFRFDAVAFIWKKLGSSCINLPETHEIVRLFRTILDYLSPKAILVTETNTPARENVTYFGNANEAHWIYNFSLPPLLIYSVLKGDSTVLEKFTMTLPPAQLGTAYLNFIASHDGIGLRPVEGILNNKQTQSLIIHMEEIGGKTSYRKSTDDIVKPYELNISLYDAVSKNFKGDDKYALERYLCIHTIMLSLEGVPAFYIHSLMGTQSDEKLYNKTQHNRDLNRHEYSEKELLNALEDTNDHRSYIYNKITNLIKIRKKQKAFHPNAVQFTLHLGKNFYGIWRQSLDKRQSIFCITNMTSKKKNFSLIDINLIGFDNWKDLISEDNINDINTEITLKPYQTMWISNL